MERARSVVVATMVGGTIWLEVAMGVVVVVSSGMVWARLVVSGAPLRVGGLAVASNGELDAGRGRGGRLLAAGGRLVVGNGRADGKDSPLTVEGRR